MYIIDPDRNYTLVEQELPLVDEEILPDAQQQQFEDFTLVTDDTTYDNDEADNEEELFISSTKSVRPLFVPRSYQRELYDAAKNDNIISVAPTGAGKTVVAVLLTQRMLLKNAQKKVLFLVNQIPLAMQQAAAFQDLLVAPFNSRVGTFYGERMITSWKLQMQRYDVLVMTAGFFINALKQNDLTFSIFQLVVCFFII